MMRIGIIVDGQGEPDFFQALIPKIKTPHEVLARPYYADMQPRATPAQIAKSAMGPVRILASKVEHIIVLIDSEGAPCPGDFADKIRSEFIRIYGKAIGFTVVAKHRSLESWLVADVDALKSFKARFKLTDTAVNQIVLDKADGCNAIKILNSIAQKQEYHKRKDPPRIAQYQSPDKVAHNSRSFRRLLRVLEHPLYKDQSKKAVVIATSVVGPAKSPITRAPTLRRWSAGRDGQT